MAELDGVWDVRRLSGALPPLVGVRKRISGASGETVVAAGRGVPFDVSPRAAKGGPVSRRATAASPPSLPASYELRYRAPLAFLVDVLEPRGDAYHGRATAFGRTYGEFELRRSTVEDTETDLIRHIDEAHALEQTVARMLDGLIRSATDQELVDRLRQHKVETLRHESLMRGRLEAHGAQPSVVRQAAGMLEAFLKMPLDLLRGERTGRAARDVYVTEHLEIASYELLRRVAERAGDEETARACLDILDEERKMAAFVEERWDDVSLS
jgi:ferritin-like metal-binding protein YciE